MERKGINYQRLLLIILAVAIIGVSFIAINKHCGERFYVWQPIYVQLGKMPVLTGDHIEVNETQYYDLVKESKTKTGFIREYSCTIR